MKSKCVCVCVLCVYMCEYVYRTSMVNLKIQDKTLLLGN